MLFDREVFYIEEDGFAEAFGLEQRAFDEIVEFLANSSDENIQIKEWVHFIIQGYVTGV